MTQEAGVPGDGEPWGSGELREADNRLLRAVDSLTDDGLDEPSLLPGWSRGHVVAHLALHAEAVSRVLEGVLEGVPDDEPPTMYDAPEARTVAIDELSGSPRDELWTRLLEGTGRFRALLDRLGPTHAAATFRRYPDGPVLPLPALPEARLREVEVHHADLGVGYGPEDWSQDFAVAVLEQALRDRAGTGPLCLRALDLDRAWWLDEPTGDAVVVTGPLRALAWWALGRGDRAGLHASAGRPPSLGRWR